MNTPIKSTLIALTLALAGLSAQAHNTSNTGHSTARFDTAARFDNQQAQQQHRIAYGLQTGQLTAQEAYRLEREQHAIRMAESRAWADGSISRDERHHLHRMQQRASRHIHHERHDCNDRHDRHDSDRRW